MLKNNAIITEFDREVFDILVEKVIIGEINENGEKNPYVISFVLKNKNGKNNSLSDEDEKKKHKKQEIKSINIEEKNILCEIKSFQKLTIFEKDEELFRNKKHLDYIKVKVLADYDGDISSDIAN